MTSGESDDFRICSVEVRLSEADLVVFQIVDYVCRSEEGVAEEVGVLTGALETECAGWCAVGVGGCWLLRGGRDRRDKFGESNVDTWAA